jgi:hypothetical protein
LEAYNILFVLYDHPTIELFSKKAITVYFLPYFALFLTAIIGCSSGVPPREPTIYDPGAPVRAVKYNEAAKINLYQDAGNGYLQIFNGSVVARNVVAKLGVKVEGGSYADGRVFLSDGLGYQVEAKQEDGLYICKYQITSDQLLVPILVQVIYSNGYASKEKFILRTCAGAEDNQLIHDGMDIFVGKDILATARGMTLNGYTINKLSPSRQSSRSSPQNAVIYAEVSKSLLNINTDFAMDDGIVDDTTSFVSPLLIFKFLFGIPVMNLGTVSMSLPEQFGTLTLDIAGDMAGLNLSAKTAYLDIHGLPNATSDALMAFDVGVFMAKNTSAFPPGVTLYSNNDTTHPKLNLASTDVQQLFETDDPEVLAKCVGVNLSMDNLTQITKNLLRGSITFDVANFPISTILSALGIRVSDKDQKIRVIFNPEGIAFDFRTGTPMLILDDLRIEYIEDDVPMWMISLDMTFSLAISSHLEMVTDLATGQASVKSSLDVHLSLVADFSSQCHVMKDDQGIGLLDHSKFVEYLVKALGKKLSSYTGDDLMFSINMENYGLSLRDAKATSGAGRYFLKMVTTESDLKKTLSYVHTEK